MPFLPILHYLNGVGFFSLLCECQRLRRYRQGVRDQHPEMRGRQDLPGIIGNKKREILALARNLFQGFFIGGKEARISRQQKASLAGFNLLHQGVQVLKLLLHFHGVQYPAAIKVVGKMRPVSQQPQDRGYRDEDRYRKRKQPAGAVYWYSSVHLRGNLPVRDLPRSPLVSGAQFTTRSQHSHKKVGGITPVRYGVFTPWPLFMGLRQDSRDESLGNRFPCFNLMSFFLVTRFSSLPGSSLVTQLSPRLQPRKRPQHTAQPNSKN